MAVRSRQMVNEKRPLSHIQSPNPSWPGLDPAIHGSPLAQTHGNGEQRRLWKPVDTRVERGHDERQAAPQPWLKTTVFVVENSSSASSPFSRPWPLFFMPPKGSSMPPPAP